jgi:hypothetical protein
MISKPKLQKLLKQQEQSQRRRQAYVANLKRRMVNAPSNDPSAPIKRPRTLPTSLQRFLADTDPRAQPKEVPAPTAERPDTAHVPDKELTMWKM